MAFTSGPFAATVTSSLTINPPQPGGTYYSQVVVSNVTPFLATVVIQSAQSFLLPYTSDVFDVTTAGTSVSVAMSQAPGGPSVSTAGASSFVTAEWYLPTDTFPGTAYPISLTSQAVAAAISGAVTSTSPQTLLATVVSATTSTTVTLPLNTETLIIETQGLTVPPAVTGVTTSNNYPVIQLRGALSTGTQTWVAFVEQAKDAQVTVSVAAGGGSTATWQVSADTAARFIAACTGSEAIANHVNPGALTSQVGGLDLSSLLRPLGVAPGGVGSVNTLVVGGVDGTPTIQSLSVTAPGAAAPSEAQVVQAGSDGTNTHLLKTDSSGNQFVLGAAVSGLKTAQWSSNLAAGATTSIIAAVGGQTITVYGFVFVVGPGAVTVGIYIGQLQSITTAVAVATLRGRAMTAVGWGSQGSELWIPGGFKLPLSEGLHVLANAGNSGNMDSAGTIYFTQA